MKNVLKNNRLCMGQDQGSYKDHVWQFPSTDEDHHKLGTVEADDRIQDVSECDFVDFIIDVTHASRYKDVLLILLV